MDENTILNQFNELNTKTKKTRNYFLKKFSNQKNY